MKKLYYKTAELSTYTQTILRKRFNRRTYTCHGYLMAVKQKKTNNPPVFLTLITTV